MPSPLRLLAALALSAPIAAAQQTVPVQQLAQARPAAEPLESPARIALTPAGELLVSDYRARRVVLLDPATLGLLRSIDVAGRPLAVGALGPQVLVGNESAQRVEIYALDGTGGQLAAILGGPGQVVLAPTDLAVDEAARRVFVVDGEAGHVKVFAPGPSGGQLVGTIGAPGSAVSDFQNPTGIALDPAAQEVYVADYGTLAAGASPRVLVFGYDGTFRDSISGYGGPTGQYFARPQGLALGARPGRVHVVDGWRGEVVVMDRASKQAVGTVGSYGRRPGELLLPLDAVVHGPSSALIVTSNLTKRLEVYPGGGKL